jgi:hypothetical protein
MDLLYWAMRSASHLHIVMAINMARKGGAFVHHCHLIHLNIVDK